MGYSFKERKTGNLTKIALTKKANFSLGAKL